MRRTESCGGRATIAATCTALLDLTDGVIGRVVLPHLAAKNLAALEASSARLAKLTRTAVGKLSSARFNVRVDPAPGCARRLRVQETLAAGDAAGLKTAISGGAHPDIDELVFKAMSKTSTSCLRVRDTNMGTPTRRDNEASFPPVKVLIDAGADCRDKPGEYTRILAVRSDRFSVERGEQHQFDAFRDLCAFLLAANLSQAFRIGFLGGGNILTVTDETGTKLH